MIKHYKPAEQNINSKQYRKPKKNNHSSSTSTSITSSELNRMDDFEFLSFIQKYPLKEQWNDLDAWNFSGNRLNNMRH